MSDTAVIPEWMGRPVDIRDVVCVHCLTVIGTSESYAGDQIAFQRHLPHCPEYMD